MQPQSGQSLRTPVSVRRPAWRRAFAVALGSIVLTFLLVWLAWPDPVPVEPGMATVGSDEFDVHEKILELRTALEGEVAARQRLESEVRQLRAEIEGARPATPGFPNTEIDAEPRSEPNERHRTAGNAPVGFDRDALLERGVDPDDVASLRAVWEEVEMQKIVLADQAAREGWANSARHQNERRAIEQDFREELSFDEYDRYLYATGKRNRTKITDVLDRSPGAIAGFEIGDTILSYGGERVFSPTDVRDLSRSGRAGETVQVEVAREGSITTLAVPRGPLGLMLIPQREPPS